MSCSRTIAIRAALTPSSAAPEGDHVSRTRSQTVMKRATANAAHACENGGVTYM